MSGAALYRLISWLATNGRKASEIAECVATVRREPLPSPKSAASARGLELIAEAESGLGVVLPKVAL